MKQFNNRKGVSLIIAVFAMMILAILGWSLAVLQSTDFEVSLRQVDSERALYLAEAGAEWALNQLSTQGSDWRTDGQSDGGDGENHILSPGEYNVLCRDSVKGEEGDAVIISTGFVPSQPDYRAMRQVEIRISHQGTFTKAVSGGQLFDWHNTRGHDLDIDGNLQAPAFEGDDEDTSVYPLQDQSPDDLDIPGDGMRILGETTLPNIDMGYFKYYADNVKGRVFNRDTIFDKKTYQNKGVYYVEGKATIDLSKNDIILNYTSIIAEDGIEIIGTHSLSMKTHVDTSARETFPNLATQDGDIISLDTPDGAADKQRRNARKFDGLIFTQYGDINFNYINGIAIMGVNMTLAGSIELKYTSKYVVTEGFIEGSVEVINWQEK